MTTTVISRQGGRRYCQAAAAAGLIAGSAHHALSAGTIPAAPNTSGVPLSNNLAAFAAPIFQDSPAGKHLFIGDSKGADLSGQLGTMGMGLLKMLPFKTKVAYWGCPGAATHLHSAIATLSNGGTFANRDTPAGGYLPNGEKNPVPSTMGVGYGTSGAGAGLGTIEFANRFVSTDAIMPSGPLVAAMRSFGCGDPFDGFACTLRLIVYKPATGSFIPDIRILPRRDGANVLADDQDGTIPVPAGSGTLAAWNFGLSAVAGRVGAYIGSHSAFAAAAGLYIAGMGLTPAALGDPIPAGPRWATLGKSAQSILEILLHLGDDAGIGLTPYCTTAQAAAWCSRQLGDDGSSGGPTDVWLYISNVSQESFGGTGIDESTKAILGDGSTTLYLTRRLIAQLKLVCPNMARLLLISPDVASYGGSPYASNATQRLIASARESAYYQASIEETAVTVSYLSINQLMGPYPTALNADASTVVPIWQDTDYSHYQEINEVIPACFVVSALKQSVLASPAGGGIEFEPPDEIGAGFVPASRVYRGRTSIG